jgi:hypothetical protein
MCCRQEELLPVWNAFRIPDFFTNSSSFLSKLSKNSYISTDYDLLAYVTPASAWCLHLVVFHEFHLDFVSVDESNIPSLFLVAVDLRGDGYVVMILKPVTLIKC